MSEMTIKEALFILDHLMTDAPGYKEAVETVKKYVKERKDELDIV